MAPNLQIIRTGDQLTITFDSEPGATYSIERTNDLANPTWVVLDSLVATESSTTWSSTVDGNAGFFRVLLSTPTADADTDNSQDARGQHLRSTSQLSAGGELTISISGQIIAPSVTPGRIVVMATTDEKNWSTDWEPVYETTADAGGHFTLENIALNGEQLWVKAYVENDGSEGFNPATEAVGFYLQNPILPTSSDISGVNLTLGSYNSVVEKVASGGLEMLKRVLARSEPNGTGELIRNEAHLSQLISGQGIANHFVPAQLGQWLSAAVLSHAYRAQEPGFTAGLSNADLMNHLTSNVNSIEHILNNTTGSNSTYAYMHSNGKKAFYQRHVASTGRSAGGGGFNDIVSLLDNTYLVAGLQVAKNYLHYRIGHPAVFDLVNRMNAILSQFDFGMWVSETTMYREANPLKGAIDRIISEGRLAPVVALARGEIDRATFATIIESLKVHSASTTTPGGTFVEYLPWYGGALEIWAATPYLSNELHGNLGKESLYPLITAWDEARQALGLPAAGATPIADGFGHFREAYHSPNEYTDGEHADINFIALPASGTAAGALGDELALANLMQAYRSFERSAVYHATYGFPNYQDFGSGLFNESDPVYGTLEIAQMVVPLLNHLLGGDYLSDLLREDPSWDQAFLEYSSCFAENLLINENFESADGWVLTGPVGFQDWSEHLVVRGWESRSSMTIRQEVSIESAGTYEFSVWILTEQNYNEIETKLRIFEAAASVPAAEKVIHPETDATWKQFTVQLNVAEGIETLTVEISSAWNTPNSSSNTAMLIDGASLRCLQ